VLDKFSRWGDWERDVLAKLPDPQASQALIRERQAVVDADGDESQEIEEFFCRQLYRLGYTEADRVFIPSAVAARWFGTATGEKTSITKSSRSLKQKVTEGMFRKIHESPGKSHGRGFIFWGNDADGSVYLQTDLQNQLDVHGDHAGS